MADRILIRVETRAGISVVHLAGHLGIDAHRELKDACERCLADPAVSELRLDLADVDSTDMTAIGLLLVLRERGHALAKRMSITGCASAPHPGLDSGDVSRFFTVV
jgi:anti-anti-sigma factor